MTSLKIVLGGLAIGVVGLLGFLLLQAARPTIKNPQPLNGTTTSKGDVIVSADVHGEANLKEVQLRLNGRAVQPVIVSHSERHWSVKYQATLAQGPHEADLTAIDQRGREQPYRWRFMAGGPSNAPKFANPLPRDGARLVAGEALISLATFSDGRSIDTLKLSLNGKALVATDVTGNRAPQGERTVASQRRALGAGDYTVRAEATDNEGEVATHQWTFTVVEAGRGEVNARFFPETGIYVFAPFAEHWARGGGVPIFGLPITPDFEQDGLIVQWFERARFERGAAPSAGRQVQLGLLGSEAREPAPPLPGPPGGDHRYFPETGHSIKGAIREFWERNGGLAQFGLPLTEEVSENGQTVQWFERARLEFHPEAIGSPDEIQLTQLGRTLWQRRR